MEFLVDFEVRTPDGTPASEVRDDEQAEASAAAKLVEEGHLVRLWKQSGHATVVALYRADSQSQLDDLLGDLRRADWIRATVTPLEPHPKVPAVDSPPQALNS